MNKAPEFIKSTGGNCGIYAVIMALDSVGVKIEPSIVEELANKNGISYFGELYTRKQILGLLDLIKEAGHDFKYECVEFYTGASFENSLREHLENGKYVLMAYYALQGFVISPRKVNMDHGHWAVIYNIDSKGHLYGVQSNSKAQMLGALNKVAYRSLFESNEALGKVKVNWGKYHKCNINIHKKELESIPRCGSELCSLNNKMSTTSCVYYSDLNNFFISIYK